MLCCTKCDPSSGTAADPKVLDEVSPLMAGPKVLESRIAEATPLAAVLVSLVAGYLHPGQVLCCEFHDRAFQPSIDVLHCVVDWLCGEPTDMWLSWVPRLRGIDRDFVIARIDSAGRRAAPPPEARLLFMLYDYARSRDLLACGYVTFGDYLYFRYIYCNKAIDYIWLGRDIGPSELEKIASKLSAGPHLTQFEWLCVNKLLHQLWEITRQRSSPGWMAVIDNFHLTAVREGYIAVWRGLYPTDQEILLSEFHAWRGWLGLKWDKTNCAVLRKYPR